MREIYIPIAQDKENDLIQLKFDLQNNSTLIVGGCGSGKTSLLRHISKHLVENYSPDVAAIHVAYKNEYTDEIINADKFEHVKILCSNNEEFEKFIETLLEEHRKRLMFLLDAGYNSIHNVPDNEIMPVIFVFIEEIHCFLINYKDKAKYNLERIMTEGHISGIKIVFTAQDCTHSLRFLSPAAKARIHQIALLTHPDVEKAKHIVSEVFLETRSVQKDIFVKDGYGVLLYSMRGGVDMRDGILLYDTENDK